jgi:carbon-monoxide dehydrogenase medium subunit
MHPAPFAYYRPASVQEAIALLAEHGEGAKLIAGGHSLLPIMKLRLAEPSHLVDIGRIDALCGVRATSDGLTIGALTTHAQVASDPQIANAAPLLAEVASRIGDRQVRNRGTIGGALAHADAAADYPAAVLALEATMVAEGPDGERSIPADEFFVDFLTTALSPEEVLTAIRVPVTAANLGWSYQKLANQASGYAIAGVAALVVPSSASSGGEVRLGVTGAAAVPWRARNAEDALRGQVLDSDAIAAAAALVADGVDLLDDLHGSAAYRRRVVQGLTRRALTEAAGRAGAGANA